MIEVKIIPYDDTYSQIINHIRHDVFVKEQGVPLELELDGLDPEATHALALDGDTQIATGRLLEDGHIGRVSVKKAFRGQHIGQRIMENLIEHAQCRGMTRVWLSSQCHAVQFYQKLGFTAFGEVFQDAGIDHIKMRKKL